MEYLEKVDPHLIMIAFPCGPSSVMQNTVARKNVLAFKAAVLENPAGAKSWDTEEISEATEGLDFACFDQCRFGLRHPVNKVPMRTEAAGQTKVIQELKEACCLGDHRHHPVEGEFKGAAGKWHSLSEHAGGYPVELCHCILKGAEAFCRA